MRTQETKLSCLLFAHGPRIQRVARHALALEHVGHARRTSPRDRAQHGVCKLRQLPCANRVAGLVAKVHEVFRRDAAQRATFAEVLERAAKVPTFLTVRSNLKPC